MEAIQASVELTSTDSDCIATPTPESEIINELSELELNLVGGGSGDVQF